MCDRMARRGPDGSGFWESDGQEVLFGHRRLSIIDLHHRSDQPMISANGRHVIVFNGEIYNYEQLRDRLIAKGARFETSSDTEVILALYAEKGAAAVDELRGMFAFAIWDNEQHSLFLARDPYGIKPLYFAQHDGRFAFASQVQALIAGGVPNETDLAGLAGFYLFGSVPEPFTIVKSISALPAGSTLLLRGGRATQRRFASVAQIFGDADSIEAPRAAEAEMLIREALHDSVRAHLVADVPVGLFLSAGVDSGALLGLMRDVSTNSIQTVTLAFEEFSGSDNDESALAAMVARHYGAEHRSRVVTKEEFGRELPELLKAMDQPTVDGVNSYFVSKATRECGLKVALSGAGGDELFGGYSTFRAIPRDVRIVSLLRGLGLAGADRAGSACSAGPANGGRWADPKIRELLRLGARDSGAYLVRRCVFTPSELPDVLGVERSREGLERLDPEGLIEAELSPIARSPYARVASLESGLYLKNQLLRDADWASMAHSLEVRLPLVDATLLRETARSLCQRRAVSKAALAESPAKPLPRAVVARRKTGFSTPIAAWLSGDERLKVWRDVPALSHRRCKWAKRWAHVVAQEFASR
jgi:asparagine synthase (glutamine-hydrolysing)